MMLVLANTPGGAGPSAAIPCRIPSIFHPRLGSVESIDTKGLDYRVVLRAGEVIEVDAEERAGTSDDEPLRVADRASLVGVHPEAPYTAWERTSAPIGARGAMPKTLGRQAGSAPLDGCAAFG